MNGITFLQGTITPIHQFQSHSGKNDGTSFLSLLDHALAGMEMAPPQVSEEIVDSELQTLISQLINGLSLSDQQLSEEDLETPLAEELLNQLPLDLQLEVADIFKQNSDIVKFLGSGHNYMENPLQLVVLVMKLSQVSDLNQEKNSSYDRAVQKLLTQLEKVAPEIIANVQAQKSNFNKQEVIIAALNRSSTGNETSALGSIPNVQGPLNQIHQFALHVGEARSEAQNGEQLLRQFKNILQRSSLTQFPNGLNKLTIKLFPQHLGRLDVTLTQQNGVFVAQLMTTTKAAKNAIESQLHQLRQAFLSQNIQVEKIEIHTQQQQPHFQPDKQNQNQEQKNNNQKNKQHNDGNDEDKNTHFQDFLNETFSVEV